MSGMARRLFSVAGFVSIGMALLGAGLAFTYAGARQWQVLATIFLNLSPRVLISSTDPSFSLTIQNASSSPYTLTVMTIVALLFVPLVLLYQGWTYWVFRRRLSRRDLQAA